MAAGRRDPRFSTQAGVTDLPIACTLTSAEFQSRGAELLPGLVARTVGRVPVTAEPDGGPISLEITGPPGTAQFLEQLVTGA